MADFGQPEIAESILSGLEQHDGFVLASSTGTGKTWASLAVVAQRRPERTVLIAPNQPILDQWIDVAPNFGLEVKKVSGSKIPEEKNVIHALTYAKLKDMLGADGRSGIASVPWDMALFDESDAGRGWYREDNKWGQAQLAVARAAKKALFLSATWAHTPLEVGVYEKLGLWKDTGFKAWGRQLGITVDKNGNFSSNPAPRKMAQLRNELIERNQFVNVDPSMEGFQAHFGVVPMTQEQHSKLRDIDAAFELAGRYYTAQRNRAMARVAKAVRATFVKRYLENIRLPQVVEMAKQAEAQGYKVLVFSENKKEFDNTQLSNFLQEPDGATQGRIGRLLPSLEQVDDYLVKALGADKVANFSGSATAARAQEKTDFLADDKQHMYTTYAAGGRGVNAHDTEGDKPRLGIYLGLPWSGIAFDQARGRFWRYGTKSDAIGIFLTSDAQPEMNLIMGKVAPRLESLHAGVSGLDKNNPIVNRMQDIDQAIQYELGSEVHTDADEFSERADTTGIQHYSKIAIPHSREMIGEGKGMKRPGEKISDAALEQGPITLFQDESNREPAADMRQKLADVLAGKSNTTPKAPAFENLLKTRRTAVKAVSDLPSAQRAAVGNIVGNAAEASAAEAQGDGTAAAAAGAKRQLDLIDTLKKMTPGGNGGGDTTIPEPPRKGGGKVPPEEQTHNALWWLDTYALTQGRNAIRKLGGQFGDTIADGITEYHLIQGKYGGPWVTEIHDLVEKHKLDRDELSGAMFAVEGRSQKWMQASLAAERFPELWGEGKDGKDAAMAKVVPILDKINAAKDKIDAAVPGLRKWVADIGAVAREHEVKVWFKNEDNKWEFAEFPEEDPNYVPHHYHPELYDTNSKRREAIVQALMETNNISRNKAEQMVARMTARTPLAGSMERAREGDAPGYRTDMGVLLRYAEQAAESVARTEAFGQKREKLDGQIAQVPNAKNARVINEIMDNLLERGQTTDEARTLATLAGDWVVFSKMAFSAIPNFSQWVNTSLRTSTHDAIAGLAKYMTDIKYWDRRALLNGSILEQNAADLMKELGVDRRPAQKFLEAVQFITADRASRGVTTAIVENWMNNTALPKLIGATPESKTARDYRRILEEKFSMSKEAVDQAITNKQWQDADLLRAGKRVNDDTQFTFDPTELPVWWRRKGANDSDQMLMSAVKIATLLKGYAFKQGVLMKDAIISEGRKGNFRPIIPAAILFPIVGTIVQQISGLIRDPFHHRRWDELMQLLEDNVDALNGNKDPMAVLAHDFTQWATAIGHVGGAGLASSLLESLSRKVSAAEFAIGPVYADAGRLAEATYNAYQHVVDGKGTKAVKDYTNWFRRSVVPARPFIPPPPRKGGVHFDEFGMPHGPGIDATTIPEPPGR